MFDFQSSSSLEGRRGSSAFLKSPDIQPFVEISTSQPVISHSPSFPSVVKKSSFLCKVSSLTSWAQWIVVDWQGHGKESGENVFTAAF